MSAMAALVNRTISPLLQTFEFERVPRRDMPKASAIAASAF
jgi:hypothetical protein